ncbi:MAG: ribosome biogenesis GTPase Der [Eubacteriales bacterium]|jgi:GTP-binding protein|nr:ribosome biogenesis GTPase Der [Bacillota bacterium]MBV1727811.1 ribosome biogenesis GTPase Der [Desulforudis sp.]MDQ7788445.1 ribosome biogenesis GTPase Der [Clostridia bacterium]MDZ4042135.1 ribosome biogenesis GTPase Der [Eubacteriales bacterium]MBU4532420.1 ribosome biogenesis GTPase Der [Bacillota bacterium]
MARLPLVAIIGRPNVGKSTFFNRILGSRTAVVEPQAGVTRDRLYREADWAGVPFTIIDTGGIGTGGPENMVEPVANQARKAMEEADIVLFMVDGKAGIVPEDQEVAAIIRRLDKPVILVVNKVDNFDAPLPTSDFYALGLGEPFPISASLGLNFGDLLDLVVSHFPSGDQPELKPSIKIALIGRPNVGKSSLVNAICGEERVIVSDMPGTTRDAIDTVFTRGETEYTLVDTAGMRRRVKVYDPIEHYSVVRAKQALKRADVAILVLDATEAIATQDQRIAGLAEDAGKATIILVNKWDLVNKDNTTVNEYTEVIRDELGFIGYAPIVFVSATTGQRVTRILDEVDTVYQEYTKKIPTAQLNKIIHESVMLTPPPTVKGRRLKVFYSTQVIAGPPTFVLFVNDPGLISDGYRRYLVNQLRRYYGFKGTPVRFAVRRREGRSS